MRLTFAFVASAVANPTAPMTLTPKEMLDQLVQWSDAILNKAFAPHKNADRLIPRWIKKFNKNADRMKNSLIKCGDDSVPIDKNENLPGYGPWMYHDDEGPTVAVVDLKNLFFRWVDLYLSSCPAQDMYHPSRRYHQIKRFMKWDNKLQDIIDDLFMQPMIDYSLKQ